MSQHDLDLQQYSLDEILQLFELDRREVTLDDIKRAKKKVLMMHPDKSKLPPKYFLFYKKAFDVVVRIYDNVVKVSQAVEDQEYVPEKGVVSSKRFQKSIDKLSQETFQEQFNTLFEQHMQKAVNPERNQWFTDETPLYEESIQNARQMGSALDKIKDQQKSLVRYSGVSPLHLGHSGNAFHEEDDCDQEEYVSSDPFSKLKYDDLRKVHKDQTVFSVRESDLQNVAQYRSVEDYERARDVRHVQPMERSSAQRLMEEQESLLQEKMRQKQYKSELATMRHANANQQVMATFLRLT